MGLAEDLLAPPDVRKGPTCRVAAILDALDPEDAAALRTVLTMSDDEMPSSVIGRRLAAAGHKTSPDTVRRHRRAECACPT